MSVQKLYDYVIPVDPIFSATENNLHLMNRLDLSAALTKINLWKQTQFSQIVYLDADILALRAPDELFDVDADLAAVPDVGWPDCFNSGLLVLKPSEKTFADLVGLAKQGKTFDGKLMNFQAIKLMLIQSCRSRSGIVEPIL